MADLWAVAAQDTDPVLSDPDPRMEARCEASIAAHEGDLLMPPPSDGLEGIFGATSDLPDRDDYRRDHPFPTVIDPDEEVDW